MQDYNRPTVSGGGSSALVEAGISRIMRIHHWATARCTVVPENCHLLFENFLYFRKLGYTRMAFVPGRCHLWKNSDIERFATELLKIVEELIIAFRYDIFIRVKCIHEYIENRQNTTIDKNPCGAGRGMALIDVHGGIWPCHRWNKEAFQTWKIGNIYESFDDKVRTQLLEGRTVITDECNTCSAKQICSGGCPCENLEITGDPFSQHHNTCRISRIFVLAAQHLHDVLYKEQNPTFLKTYYEKEQDELR